MTAMLLADEVCRMPLPVPTPCTPSPTPSCLCVCLAFSRVSALTDGILSALSRSLTPWPYETEDSRNVSSRLSYIFVVILQQFLC